MRIDRYLANATGLSRRLVHIEIKSGNVSLDGNPVKTIGQQMGPEQVVALNGVRVTPAQHVYLMLNKPKNVVCANSDGAHPTVLDLLGDAKETRHPSEPLQIAGRLDMDTTGLVLLTTDGQWNHKITAPSSNCSKTYFVQLAAPITHEEIKILEAGVLLKSEKKPTLPCKIQIVDAETLRIELSEGKYHQVKRMFAFVGNKVLNLHRERIGKILLPNDLAVGEFKLLSQFEIGSV